jgi:hypothetical protein
MVEVEDSRIVLPAIDTGAVEEVLEDHATMDVLSSRVIFRLLDASPLVLAVATLCTESELSGLSP